MRPSKQKIVQVGDYTQYKVKISSIVEMTEEFTILSDDGEIKLEVTISADFEEIPEKYREIFINMMTTKYMNRASLTTNLYSQYKPIPQKSWTEKIFEYIKFKLLTI
jgi:hypothetical protein